MKSRANVITSLLILAAFLTIADTNIVFGVGPTPLPTVDVNNLEISPDKISHQDTLPDITITLELELTDGNDLKKEDIIDANLIIVPYVNISDISDANGIKVNFKEEDITAKNGKVTIIAMFDIADTMDDLSDHYGPLNLYIEGESKSVHILPKYAEDAITIIHLSDYVSNDSIINFDQIWDYGDPTDSTDLMYEFRLAISSDQSEAKNIDDDIVSIDFLTPAGQTFEIPKKGGEWSYPLEYKVRSADRADLQDYGDGEYTITLHLDDGIYVQTKAFFGNPYTEQPIPQPTQDPNLTHVLQKETEGSLVTFNWNPFDDLSADEIYIKVLGTFNNNLGDKWRDFNFNQTSWGPVLLLEGSWQIELIFSTLTSDDLHWKNRNDDGIWIGVAKSSRSRYRITVEDSPWNIYEVWGGNEELDWLDYSYTDKLEAYGYKRLEGSKKFSDKDNKFDYYLIATKGQCFIESIQGSDGTFYTPLNSFDYYAHNIDNENNLFGEPEKPKPLCATFGFENGIFDNNYNGYFVFKDPNNWEWLIVYTCDRNLNLDKSLVSVTDEEGNIKDTNDIDPNDIITYSITFDTSDFPLDEKDEKDVKNEKDENNATSNTVNNIKVVDILSDHVIFLDASTPESNEITESHDPIAHTYTRQYPAVDLETTKSHLLIVRVNPDTLPGTTITNFVTIDSDQTPPSIARSMDLTIPYEPLNITTRTINSDGNDINWIESGKSFIYEICFDNNNNGPQVENVILIAELPPTEVTSVDAQDDHGNSIGNYDPATGIFTLMIDALEPGLETCLKITVEVNEDTPGTIINNVATIGSNETPDANDVISIEVKPPLEAELIITPDIMIRDGASQYITAVIKFPAEIQQSDIDLNNIPKLYYQDRYTSEFLLIVNGSPPTLSGNGISTLFNRTKLMQEIDGYGEFNLKVKGQLKSGRTFYGCETIHITMFSGD